MLNFHRFATCVRLALVLLGTICAAPSWAQPTQALHPKYSVQFFHLQVENQDLRMAYRDVQPTGAANGKAVLLLHGKNFSGFYWEPTIEFLAQQGYRVIAPDQLGFGASSRPDIHYSFHQMAQNTKALLDHLGLKQVDVIAHSMGGMLGVRFTLLFPETVERLVLENPIGLEELPQTRALHSSAAAVCGGVEPKLRQDARLPENLLPGSLEAGIRGLCAGSGQCHRHR